jgi:hypothetical protein
LESHLIKVVGKVRASVQAKLYEIINRIFGNFEHVKLQDKDRHKASLNKF